MAGKDGSTDHEYSSYPARTVRKASLATWGRVTLTSTTSSTLLHGTVGVVGGIVRLLGTVREADLLVINRRRPAKSSMLVKENSKIVQKEKAEKDNDKENMQCKHLEDLVAR